jgi:hypothetical protein
MRRMVDAAPKRRRFRFSLRALLLVFVVLSLWLGWNYHQLRQRAWLAQFLSAQHKAGFTFGPPTRPWKRLPLTWRLMGTKSVQRIDAQDPYHRLSDEDRRRILASFPEADVVF